jgi:Flp pilus assembly pilin Flp
MVEYALLAGFVAVSAGAVLPGVAGSLGEIYSKVQSITDKAAGSEQRDGDKLPTGTENQA